MLPGEIERVSMATIQEELDQMGIVIPAENEAVVKRVIHTTADFDFAENLRFTSSAISRGVSALRQGIPIVTDTNMAKAGVSRPVLAKLRSEAHCFMADPDIAGEAQRSGTTRAVASVRKAAAAFPNAILAIGNAPTALLEIAARMENGLRPALVIAVPVGFVNVVEAKKRVWETCLKYDVPAIAAMGRKGGSTVAAAICNALLYEAVGRKL